MADRKAYFKQYRIEHKEEKKAKAKIYFEKNKELVHANQRACYQRHKEEIAIKHAKWYRDNIEWVKKYNKENYERDEIRRKLRHKNGYLRPRQRFLNDYKMKKGCIVCGYNKCSYSLDCHHKDEKEKKFTISQELNLSKYTLKEIKEELAKCDILCKNCHGELHWGLLHPRKFI